jgi:hypothetical protein
MELLQALYEKDLSFIGNIMGNILNMKKVLFFSFIGTIVGMF